MNKINSRSKQQEEDQRKGITDQRILKIMEAYNARMAAAAAEVTKQQQKQQQSMMQMMQMHHSYLHDNNNKIATTTTTGGGSGAGVGSATMFHHNDNFNNSNNNNLVHVLPTSRVGPSNFQNHQQQLQSRMKSQPSWTVTNNNKGKIVPTGASAAAAATAAATASQQSQQAATLSNTTNKNTSIINNAIDNNLLRHIRDAKYHIYQHRQQQQQQQQEEQERQHQHQHQQHHQLAAAVSNATTTTNSYSPAPLAGAVALAKSVKDANAIIAEAERRKHHHDNAIIRAASSAGYTMPPSATLQQAQHVSPQGVANPQQRQNEYTVAARTPTIAPAAAGMAQNGVMTASANNNKTMIGVATKPRNISNKKPSYTSTPPPPTTTTAVVKDVAVVDVKKPIAAAAAAATTTRITKKMGAGSAMPNVKISSKPSIVTHLSPSSTTTTIDLVSKHNNNNKSTKKIKSNSSSSSNDVKNTNGTYHYKKSQLVKPKRPLCAYNLFFKDERMRIKNLIAQNNMMHHSDPKKQKNQVGLIEGTVGNRCLDFEQLGKTIGSRWKSIDPETKQKYQARAAIRKEQYIRERNVYKRKLSMLEEELKQEEKQHQIQQEIQHKLLEEKEPKRQEVQEEDSNKNGDNSKTNSNPLSALANIALLAGFPSITMESNHYEKQRAKKSSLSTMASLPSSSSSSSSSTLQNNNNTSPKDVSAIQQINEEVNVLLPPIAAQQKRTVQPATAHGGANQTKGMVYPEQVLSQVSPSPPRNEAPSQHGKGHKEEEEEAMTGIGGRSTTNVTPVVAADALTPSTPTTEEPQQEKQQQQKQGAAVKLQTLGRRVDPNDVIFVSPDDNDGYTLKDSQLGNQIYYDLITRNLALYTNIISTSAYFANKSNNNNNNSNSSSSSEDDFIQNEKRKLCKYIVNEIRLHNGRFLENDVTEKVITTNNGNQEEVWIYEIGDKKAIEKTLMAFEEKKQQQEQIEKNNNNNNKEGGPL